MQHHVQDELCVALVVHKTQGLTCEVGLLLGDDALYAELGYTGLTRGSLENHLYTVVPDRLFDEDGDPLADLIKALDKSLAKTAAIDLAAPVAVG